MLTKLTVRNFKRFGRAEIELGDPAVFIGPNNSGKTSALQALALWDIGVKRWNEKRKDKKAPAKRPGVTINRRDLVSLPIPHANLLWRDLHVRDVRRNEGKQTTTNVCIDVIIDGITNDQPWTCGMEFDYANEESFYCRPLRCSEGSTPDRMPMPDEAASVRVAFLPPMSGLAANEIRLDPGTIDVRIGEGRTADVLRNLCHGIHDAHPDQWGKLEHRISSLFRAKLHPPEYIAERGEITMRYEEQGSVFDLSSSGRGLQQTLLLLSYMFANPGAVLLLDEPDAHLEILRQRQIYQVLTDVARENGNQVIAASHSEVLLAEAAGRDVVVAFVGQPHRIDDRGSQVLKALRDISFEHYYLAEQAGWILYLEGSTDLAILRGFAEVLQDDDAKRALERPFVHYVTNDPNEVRRHFHGLREAVPHLRGIAIFDRLGRELPGDIGVTPVQWKRREIENYLCDRDTLEAYALQEKLSDTAGPLFSASQGERRRRVMQECITELEEALEKLEKGSPWDPDTKVSDDFLEPLFKRYFGGLGLLNVMAKKNFHELVAFVPIERIAPEIKDCLATIVRVCSEAHAASEVE